MLFFLIFLLIPSAVSAKPAGDRNIEVTATTDKNGNKVVKFSNSGGGILQRQFSTSKTVNKNGQVTVKITSRNQPAAASASFAPSTSSTRGYGFSRLDVSFSGNQGRNLPPIYIDVKSSFGAKFSNVSAGSSMLNLSQILINEGFKNNIDPLLIKIVIRYESNFNPYALSCKGAGGLMQLMPGTAAGLGVYNLFDPFENVAGGVKYLKFQLDRFGDIALALAAYNAGPGAVLTYGTIPPYEETQNYVQNILSDYVRERAAMNYTAKKKAVCKWKKINVPVTVEVVSYPKT